MATIKTKTIQNPEAITEYVDYHEWHALCRKAGKSFVWALLLKPARVQGQPWPDHCQHNAAEVGCVLPK